MPQLSWLYQWKTKADTCQVILAERETCLLQADRVPSLYLWMWLAILLTGSSVTPGVNAALKMKWNIANKQLTLSFCEDEKIIISWLKDLNATDIS